MNRVCLFLIVIFLSNLSFRVAQENDGLVAAQARLKEVNEYYALHPEYSVELKHIMYSSFSSTTVDESYKGFFTYSSNNEHSKIMGIETIQNSEIRVVVDTTMKSIIVSKPRTVVAFSSDLLRIAMKQCNRAEVKDTLNNTSIDLYFNSDYYPISHIRIVTKDHRVMSLDMWHTEEIENSKNEKVFPHTRIEYSNYVENIRNRKSEFNTNHVVEKRGANYQLAGLYKSYTLYDLTKQP